MLNKSIGIKDSIKDLKKYENEKNIFITIDPKIKENDLKQSELNYYLCKNNCSKCKNCFKENNHITLCYKH